MQTSTMSVSLWRYQPFKLIYLAYVATSLLFRVPLWIALFQVPWLRPRASWTVGRSVLVKTLQVIVAAVFDTASWKTLRADLRVFAKNPEKAGLVWLDARPDLIVGEIKELAARNKVTVEQVAGFWYGKRDVSGKVGQRAGPDEKVMYAFHGKLACYVCLVWKLSTPSTILISWRLRGELLESLKNERNRQSLMTFSDTDR